MSDIGDIEIDVDAHLRLYNRIRFSLTSAPGLWERIEVGTTFTQAAPGTKAPGVGLRLRPLATTPVERVLATAVMAARQIVATSERGSCPFLQVSSYECSSLKAVSRFIHHTVHIHAALVVGGLALVAASLCCCCYVILARQPSRRVSPG
jgi:hypothetical protein